MTTANTLDALRKFIEALQKKNEILVKDFIIAKVSDTELANTLADEINKISSILNDLEIADTEEKLNKALLSAKDKLTKQ